MKRILKWVASLVVVATIFPCGSRAQYFGQNKPSYRTFRYQVKQMPHFEIYHYLEDEQLLNYFANRAEECMLCISACLPIPLRKEIH